MDTNSTRARAGDKLLALHPRVEMGDAEQGFPRPSNDVH
jgi:hypothetical protein